MSLDERKSTLIQSCFLEMADMDYLAARWTYHNGIFHNFCWLAAQCIEKYLKAALLYNNKTSKGLRHDLNNLYSAISDIDPKFSSLIISMPNTTGGGRENWHEKPMSLFVNYLNSYGSPDGRYSLTGVFINGPVIHPLDSLCAHLRRFIRHNNFISSDLFQWSETKNYFHDRIGLDSDWMVSNNLLLEQLFAHKYHVGQTKELRSTFQNMNFAFFTEHHNDETTFGGQCFTLAPMVNHLFRLPVLDNSEENIRIVDELRVWAAANITLSKEIQAALDGKITLNFTKLF